MAIKPVVSVDLKKLIDDSFPFNEYRENQKEVIEDILKAFKKYKYVILEAPTGSGKSAIAMTLADLNKRLSKKTHILTIQKLLQDQYARDFEGQLFVMKGKSNFICKINGDKCTLGECEKTNNKELKSECKCPYKIEAHKAEKADITVHNFDSFYYQKGIFFTKRPLMIIDEVHNLESKFMDFVSFTIDNRLLTNSEIPKPNDFTDITYYDTFVESYKTELLSKYNDLDSRASLTIDQVIFKDKVDRLAQKISIFQRVKKQGIQFVFEYTQEREYQKIKFKPIFVWSFTSQIFNFADNVLMMSATILDADNFAKNIGIKKDEYCFMEMPSLFPVENRLFYITDQINLTWKTYKEEIKKIPKIIEQYLDMHSDDRGIIHTHTNKIVFYIKNHCNAKTLKRMLFKGDFSSTSDLLKKHSARKNSVIVASGFHEGLDLKDDLSRFQIIMKVPYPDLSDKQIKARMDIDKSYYGWLTALKLVQSYGRSVRTDEDYCETYCIDKNFRMFYGMNKKMLPKWFKEAIVWE